MTTATMTMTAPDISCEHCQRAIEGAVGALPGVSAVRVEIPTKAVRVAYDPAQVAVRACSVRMGWTFSPGRPLSLRAVTRPVGGWFRVASPGHLPGRRHAIRRATGGPGRPPG